MICVCGGPKPFGPPVYDLEAYNKEAASLRRAVGVQDEPHLTVIETEIHYRGVIPAQEYLTQLAMANYPTPPHGNPEEPDSDNVEFWRGHDEGFHFGNAVTAHPKTVEWIIRLAQAGLNELENGNELTADTFTDRLDGVLGTGFLSALTYIFERRREVPKAMAASTGLSAEQVIMIGSEFESPHRRKVISYLFEQERKFWAD